MVFLSGPLLGIGRPRELLDNSRPPHKRAEIAHKGYHKTSFGAIARMCGIGRTRIYE
jgi:hypothetical protein